MTLAAESLGFTSAADAIRSAPAIATEAARMKAEREATAALTAALAAVHAVGVSADYVLREVAQIWEA